MQYCARTLKPNIISLEKSAQQILKRSDIEDVHDIRVASRRISAVFDSFSDHLPGKKAKAWNKEIRTVTRAFGKVRDIDVQLDLIKKSYEETADKKIRPGIRRIKLRLEQKREQKQKKTDKETQALLESHFLQEISEWIDAVLADSTSEDHYSPGLYQLGYKQIQNRLDEFLFFEVFIFDSQRVEELHTMRISAKKLRYALEIFSDLYDQETNSALKVTKQSQDYLGEIHDCDVWIDFLPKFMEREYKRIKEFYGYTRPYSRIRPGMEHFISNRQDERQRLYQAFLKDWKDWKLKETWLNLRKVIFLTSLEMQSSLPEEIDRNGEAPAVQADKTEKNLSSPDGDANIPSKD